MNTTLKWKEKRCVYISYLPSTDDGLPTRKKKNVFFSICTRYKMRKDSGRKMQISWLYLFSTSIICLSHQPILNMKLIVLFSNVKPIHQTPFLFSFMYLFIYFLLCYIWKKFLFAYIWRKWIEPQISYWIWWMVKDNLPITIAWPLCHLRNKKNTVVFYV